MIEVSKVVIEKDGKFLLLKRVSNSKNYPNLWDFAGGKHDPGETPPQAVIRETKEETSYEINPGEEIKKEEHDEFEKKWRFHYFIPKTISGELKLSPDHSDHKWVSKEEMISLELHPSVKLYFN